MDQVKDQFDDNLFKTISNDNVFFFLIFLPSTFDKSCVRVFGVDRLDISANNGG